MMPGLAATLFTRPARGARIMCSIFMASSASSGWPFVTSSPTTTSTLVTTPGMGASSPAPCAPPAARLRPSASRSSTKSSVPRRTKRRAAAAVTSATVTPASLVRRSLPSGMVSERTSNSAPSTDTFQCPGPSAVSSTSRVRSPSRHRDFMSRAPADASVRARRTDRAPQPPTLRPPRREPHRPPAEESRRSPRRRAPGRARAPA